MYVGTYIEAEVFLAPQWSLIGVDDAAMIWKKVSQPSLGFLFDTFFPLSAFHCCPNGIARLGQFTTWRLEVSAEALADLQGCRTMDSDEIGNGIRT